MSYIRNLAMFTLFALISTGCGGGNSISANDNGGGNSIGAGAGGAGGGAPSGTPGTVSLQWSAPTTLADGITGISPSEITGYTLFYGPTATNTPNAVNINSGSATQYNITLPSGTYFFRISAIDSSGHPGLMSVALQKTI